MAHMICPGLPAGWINAWLAAVGATVLDSRIRLHWTGDGGTPVAVLSAEDVDPLDAVVASWPDAELLTDLPIAEHWRGTGRLGRKVPVANFVARAQTARSHPYSWTLSSTMTDLYVDEKGEVVHAPFDPPAPKGITLHHRLMKVHEQVEPSIERMRGSFEGRAVRVKANGLGFDHTRLGSQSDDTSPWVDPVVEVLAFFGLAILPVRGGGIGRRQSGASDARERQRGWLRTRTPGSKWERRFMWPAWCQPLDCAGIDALMDVWEPRSKDAWSRTGVHAGWQSVQFEPSGKDVTRAFGAEQL